MFEYINIAPHIFKHLEPNAYWFPGDVIMLLHHSMKGTQNLILNTFFIPEKLLSFDWLN